MPSEMLDTTLLCMGEYARYMIENKYEGLRILEMHGCHIVLLSTTLSDEIDDDDHPHASIATLVRS